MAPDRPTAQCRVNLLTMYVGALGRWLERSEREELCHAASGSAVNRYVRCGIRYGILSSREDGETVFYYSDFYTSRLRRDMELERGACTTLTPQYRLPIVSIIVQSCINIFHAMFIVWYLAVAHKDQRDELSTAIALAWLLSSYRHCNNARVECQGIRGLHIYSCRHACNAIPIRRMWQEFSRHPAGDGTRRYWAQMALGLSLSCLRPASDRDARQLDSSTARQIHQTACSILST